MSQSVHFLPEILGQNGTKWDISTAKDCLSYMMLIKEELGEEWIRPSLFRFGASSLLSDIERQDLAERFEEIHRKFKQMNGLLYKYHQVSFFH